MGSQGSVQKGSCARAHTHRHGHTQTPVRVNITQVTMTPVPVAHLSLDVSHALVVQLWRGAHFEDEPRARRVVHVEHDGQRQQEQTHEDPPLVDDDVLETLDFDPQQQRDDRAG